MAQTLATLNNRIGSGQELLLQGVRRLRFTLHFKTWHTRRWLLVQWVSAPVQVTGEWLGKVGRRFSREQFQPTLSSVLDQFRFDMSLRRTF